MCFDIKKWDMRIIITRGQTLAWAQETSSVRGKHKSGVFSPNVFLLRGMPWVANMQLNYMQQLWYRQCTQQSLLLRSLLNLYTYVRTYQSILNANITLLLIC
jgi:hypothetical protein